MCHSRKNRCLSFIMEEKISSSERGKSRIVDFAQRIVSSNTFDWIITGVILLQAFALAIEATPALLSMGKDIGLFEAETFRLIQSLVISVFIVEAALRLIAVYPRPQTYFKEPWNCFDFAIIILSLLVIGVAVLLLSIYDFEKGLLNLAFEAFSAFSTVGLSLGVTPGLSMFGKFVIMAVMFIGRVGALTMLFALVTRSEERPYRYPTEEVMF